MREPREFLRALSHPLRRDITKSLEDGAKTFSVVMVTCGLDPNHDSGLFCYHLNELIKSGMVERDKESYHLTAFGRNALSIARSAEAVSVSEKEGGPAMGREEVKKNSMRRRMIDRRKTIEVKPITKPTIQIGMNDCRVELGNVYWGLTKKTVGVDKVTVLWQLHDQSTLFEVREPVKSGLTPM